MRTTSIFLFFIISGFVWSQITITHADYEKVWAVGSSIKTYSTPVGSQVSVFVGTESGSPQTWDFTTYTLIHVGNSIGVEPSSAPFFSQFPDANAVLYGIFFYTRTDTTHTWQYHRIDNDHLSLYGVSNNTAILFNYDPPVLQALIPLAMGVTWERRDSVAIFPPYFVVTETTTKVDAFGTLKLPSGNYDCLRLTQHKLTISTTPAGTDTTRTRSHHFYTKDFIELNVLTVEEAQFNQTTVDGLSISYSILDHAGSIGENNTNANNGYLYPNSPNPFHNSTTICFCLKTTDMVSIRIFDFLGKEVRTLVNENHSQGQHEVTFNAEGLQAGMYVCQLKSGNTLQSRKLILTK